MRAIQNSDKCNNVGMPVNDVNIHKICNNQIPQFIDIDNVNTNFKLLTSDYIRTCIVQLTGNTLQFQNVEMT